MKSVMKFVAVIALSAMAVCAFAAEKKDVKICGTTESAQMTYTQGDKIFAAFEKKNGSIELVYTGEKPARIYSWNGTKEIPLKPGTELMILNIPGRSKAKVKMYMGGKFTSFARDFQPADEIKPGEKIGVFFPLLLAHDSVEAGSSNKGLGKMSDMFKGLWESTGIYDLLRQGKGDWVLGWRSEEHTSDSSHAT